MTEPNGIVEFLTARLDEDEAAAKAAAPGPWLAGTERDHLVDEVVYGQSEWPDHIVQACNVKYADPENVHHIARHDPARVLREVAAKRRVMARHSGFDGPEIVSGGRYDPLDPHSGWHAECAGHCLDKTWPCDELRDLAAAYADHPDYDESWRS